MEQLRTQLAAPATPVLANDQIIDLQVRIKSLEEELGKIQEQLQAWQTKFPQLTPLQARLESDKHERDAERMRKEANFYRGLWKQIFDTDDENYLRIDQLKKQIYRLGHAPEPRVVKVQGHYSPLSEQDLTAEVEQLSNQIEITKN